MTRIHKSRPTALVGMMTLILGMLFIPAAQAQSSTSCGAYYNVQSGDTLSRIARAMNVTISQLQTWNRLANIHHIYAGQSLCVRMSTIVDDVTTGRTHIVQRGETLSSIARRYGISMTVLAQVNRITNYNRILVGQVLQIPDVTIQ